MKRDIVAIVAEQLGNAQMDHNDALEEVEHAQRILNKKKVLLVRAEQCLGNIEEIHNAITQD